jgi:hypothetical protein
MSDLTGPERGGDRRRLRHGAPLTTRLLSAGAHVTDVDADAAQRVVGSLGGLGVPRPHGEPATEAHRAAGRGR